MQPSGTAKAPPSPRLQHRPQPIPGFLGLRMPSAGAGAAANYPPQSPLIGPATPLTGPVAPAAVRQNAAAPLHAPPVESLSTLALARPPPVAAHAGLALPADPFRRTAITPAARAASQDAAGGVAYVRVQDEAQLAHWVTLFGFPPELGPVVLRMFTGYGTITDQCVPQGPANFMHVRYADALQARRALQGNGRRADGCLIVGVLPCQDISVLGRGSVGQLDSDRAATAPDEPWRTDNGVAQYRSDQERPRKRARASADLWTNVLNWGGKLAEILLN